jgi:hypothetical protein
MPIKLGIAIAAKPRYKYLKFTTLILLNIKYGLLFLFCF